MTMQTFVVMLIGILFGWKLGLFHSIIISMEGIVGLPVFAGTQKRNGYSIFYWTYHGLLAWFLVTVYLTGFLKFDNNF